MRNLEVEFKYRAGDIPLSEFTSFCKAQGPSRYITAAGFDYFYAGGEKGTDCFARHRVGPSFNQLTFKRKHADKNNYVRTEHNIDLGPDVSPEQTEALCAEFGYRFNTSIYKNVFLYEFPTHTLVYYVCYDRDLAELGRFIEIEMSESHPWESEEQAWKSLLSIEQAAKSLGISPQKRVKNSLFEMFRS